MLKTKLLLSLLLCSLFAMSNQALASSYDEEESVEAPVDANGNPIYPTGEPEEESSED